MARHLRVVFPEAIYHVSCRMIGEWRTEKNELFRDNLDRERFVTRLAERVEQYHIRLYLFALMSNHVHLVFETPDSNCPQFMQALSTAYTVYFNRRHHRHGHLFDGRYKAKLVEGDAYLLALSRYVHLNPVSVAAHQHKSIETRTQLLRAYPWSSYAGYTDPQQAVDFIQYGPLLSQMGGPERDWPRRYRDFVEAGLAEDDHDFMEAMRRSPRSIGSDDFRIWVDGCYEQRMAQYRCREDVSFRQRSVFLPSAAVVEVLSTLFEEGSDAFMGRRRCGLHRAVAARCLMRYAGLTQREVARLLKAGGGAAICSQLARLDEGMQADRKLAALMGKAEKQLDTMKAAHVESGKQQG